VPVDPETYRRYLLAEKKAKDLGLSLIEALDHAQLLLTQKRRHNIAVQSVEELSRRLDRQSPNKLLSHFYHRADGTAAEMFDAVKQWVDLVLHHQANNTLDEL
jgi:hypothetical protein